MGKLKGENVDRVHHVPCYNITSSGHKVKVVIERLVQEKERFRLMKGTMISYHQGVMYTSSELDDLMHELLDNIMAEESALFPPDVKNRDDLINNDHSGVPLINEQRRKRYPLRTSRQ